MSTTACDFPIGWPFPLNPYPVVQGWVGTTTFTLGQPTRLSDEDVERIAKRVVEIIKAAP